MDDGGWWAVYPECPVHQERRYSPVFSPRYGDLNSTTGEDQSPVIQ